MVLDPKLSQDNAFTRSTPLGVTLVHVLLAGIGAGSVATITDGRPQTTLMATAKELIFLRIVNRAKNKRAAAAHRRTRRSVRLRGYRYHNRLEFSKEFKQFSGSAGLATQLNRYPYRIE
jgi:hypothetical protein